MSKLTELRETHATTLASARQQRDETLRSVVPNAETAYENARQRAAADFDAGLSEAIEELQDAQTRSSSARETLNEQRAEQAEQLKQLALQLSSTNLALKIQAQQAELRQRIIDNPSEAQHAKISMSSVLRFGKGKDWEPSIGDERYALYTYATTHAAKDPAEIVRVFHELLEPYIASGLITAAVKAEAAIDTLTYYPLYILEITVSI